MRLLRFALFSFLLLFLLITVVSFFFPSHVRVSRAIDIMAPADKVHEQLSRANQWKNWLPGGDTLLLVEEKGQAIGIRTPNGNALVISAISADQIQAKGTLNASIKASMGWQIIGDSAAAHRTVQWYMDFYFDWYPWEKFASLLLEPRYGAYMELGLQRLKLYCEEQP
jgi:hypothetical protein